MILRSSTNDSNALVFVPKIREKFGLLMSLGIAGSLDTVRRIKQVSGSPYLRMDRQPSAT